MIHRTNLTAALAFLATASLATACSGSSAEPIVGDDPELNAASSSLASGDFPTVERAGDQLSPFGCRHYEQLTVGGGKSPHATLTAKLDSADPSEMDSDGSCGGEELPKGEKSDYPLKLVEKTSCGAKVFQGTIKWTTDGKVTRTMRLTDYRPGTCATKPARVVAELTSSYKGDTNKIATYYSVDPR